MLDSQLKAAQAFQKTTLASSVGVSHSKEFNSTTSAITTSIAQLEGRVPHFPGDTRRNLREHG